MNMEYRNFLRSKYLLFLIPIILLFIIIGHLTITENDSYVDKDSNFDMEIEYFANQEELQQLYEKALNTPIAPPGTSVGTNPQLVQKRQIVYKYMLDNNLPYDSLAPFNFNDHKFSQFSYINNFAFSLCQFLIIACLLVGSLVFTTDFANHTAKLVYTKGESRKKIIWRKYSVALSFLASIVTVFYIIYALVGLYFAKNGVQFTYFIYGGKLIALNYAQVFLLQYANLLLTLVCQFTTVYFVSILLRNGLVSIIINFLLFFVYLFASQFIAQMSMDIKCIVDMYYLGIVRWFDYVRVDSSNFWSLHLLYGAISPAVAVIVASVATHLFNKQEIRS
ncbi:MAG: ABC transporter permease [Clostridia bacterium]